MNSSFISRWASMLIGLPLLIGVLIGIYQAGFTELKQRPMKVRQQAMSVVDRVSSGLEVTLQALERSTLLFAQANIVTLERLVVQPDSPVLLNTLRDKLLTTFPEAYSATISSQQGQPLMELELGLMGEVCKHDLHEFVATGHQRDIFLHPVSGAPHIDIMVPLKLMLRDYVFFISFKPDFIVEVLAEQQLPDHELLLVRDDKPNLVEITADGDRTMGVRHNFVTPREVENILAQSPVAGTRWNLVNLPHEKVLESFRFKWSDPSVIVFFGVMLLGAWLVFYLQFLHLKTARYARELHILNNELSQASLHDALTGLPNRRLFHERLNQAIHEASRDGKRLALMLLDLNRFKEVNDMLGHQVGDRLLQVIGMRVRSLLRDVDTVARLGGDEFVVLVRVDSREQAELVAAKVVSTIGQEVTLGDVQLNVSASLGIALYPDHSLTLETLINCADQAMYKAKNNNQVTSFYEPDSSEGFPDRLQLMAALPEAIRAGQLRLWYQPQISLKDTNSEVCRVEALVRWQHPVQGLLYPDDFLPLAEQANAIRALTEWVINETLQAIQRFQQNGMKLAVGVNLSVKVLDDMNLVDWVAATVADAGIEAQAICFEVTESAEMVNSSANKDVLNALDKAGFRISIDDFGTGYSSLSMLRMLPVTGLKIDRSFITGLENDRQNQDIVSSTLKMAHALGFSVIAEGVESRETADLLEEMECDVLQGYGLAEPMPEAALQIWCEDNSQVDTHEA